MSRQVFGAQRIGGSLRIGRLDPTRAATVA